MEFNFNSELLILRTHMACKQSTILIMYTSVSYKLAVSLACIRRPQETPLTYGRWLSPDDAVLRPFFPVQHFFVYQFCNKQDAIM